MQNSKNSTTTFQLVSIPPRIKVKLKFLTSLFFKGFPFNPSAQAIPFKTPHTCDIS